MLPVQAILVGSDACHKDTTLLGLGQSLRMHKLFQRSGQGLEKDGQQIIWQIIIAHSKRLAELLKRT